VTSHRLGIASAIQAEFAARTGLWPIRAQPRRYLWTDAFAVCNDLELHRLTGKREPFERALLLIEQVHVTLGRHRPDDVRRGWISGLAEEEGRAHPTSGGLRIGKEHNERAPGEPENERLEWERDGQYFHYLTKWMHALARAHFAGGDERHLAWAVELALAAHAGFLRATSGGGRKRLVWKMSIDLSRSLVASMGQHDPLDGLVTYLELAISARRARMTLAADALQGPIADLRALCEGMSWGTLDPLGLGGLLADAHRLTQLARMESLADTALLPDLLETARLGLSALARSPILEGPAEERLAFRELGLAIGLHAVERLADLSQAGDLSAGVRGALARSLDELRPFVPLAAAIEHFWLDPEHQAARSWREHLDIDAVMLATSLLPDGFLGV
jgi:hypothetical protein